MNERHINIYGTTYRLLNKIDTGLSALSYSNANGIPGHREQLYGVRIYCGMMAVMDFIGIEIKEEVARKLRMGWWVEVT